MVRLLVDNVIDALRDRQRGCDVDDSHLRIAGMAMSRAWVVYYSIRPHTCSWKKSPYTSPYPLGYQH